MRIKKRKGDFVVEFGRGVIYGPFYRRTDAEKYLKKYGQSAGLVTRLLLP